MDDDNYVNVRALLRLLAGFPHTQDLYIGKPSLDRPIQATERVGENKLVSVGLRGTGSEVGGSLLPTSPPFLSTAPRAFLVRHRRSWFLHQPRAGSEDEALGQVRPRGQDKTG